MPGSEPRLQIQNLASTNLLYYDGDWRVGTIDEQKSGERHVKYKLEWHEKQGDFAKTVFIRTDKHPQKLLDADAMKLQNEHIPGLNFSPSAFQKGNGGKKCKSRWWKVTYLDVSENNVTVLFQSYTSGLYLAEKVDGSGVELIEKDDDTQTQDIPTRAKWGLTIIGSAFSPGQVAFLCMTPFILALGAVTGGAATGSFAAALEAAGASTIGGIVNCTAGIAIGAAVGGTLSIAQGASMADLLKEVTDKMFVK